MKSLSESFLHFFREDRYILFTELVQSYRHIGITLVNYVINMFSVLSDKICAQVDVGGYLENHPCKGMNEAAVAE